MTTDKISPRARAFATYVAQVLSEEPEHLAGDLRLGLRRVEPRLHDLSGVQIVGVHPSPSGARVDLFVHYRNAVPDKRADCACGARGHALSDDGVQTRAMRVRIPDAGGQMDAWVEDIGPAVCR